MKKILKQINRDRIKQEISAIDYMLYSIYKSGDLQGESDNPIPYEAQYSALVIAGFQKEFEQHLREIIESGLFGTTFDVSYYPQVDPQNIEEMTSMLTDLLNRPFSAEFAVQFKPEIESLITELYMASAIVGGQMANIIDPSAFVFDLVDRQTIEALNNIGVLWISEGAKRHIITDSVTALAKRAIEDGMGLTDAGILFRESLLDVVSGKSEIYYQNLASIVLNRARNVARVNQFSRLGVTYCEWLAIPDARICGICEHLDGTVWKVEHLKQVVENLVSATTPEEVIETTPFINSIQEDMFVLNNGTTVDMNADTEVLARLGVSPPVHGNCRCQLIIYTS